MARKKSVEERMKDLVSEIKVIETRIENDKDKLQKKKKLLKELETESTMAMIQAYKVSASELKELLKKHAAGKQVFPQAQQGQAPQQPTMKNQH